MNNSDDITLHTNIDSANIYSSRHVNCIEDCSNFVKQRLNLSILNFNIRSVMKNFDNFCVFLTRLKIKIDVIILTECRLRNRSFTTNIPEYTLYTTNNHKLQNDGVVVYVRNGYNVDVKEVLIEGANCLSIKIDSKYLIYAVYRSPSQYHIQNFLSSIDSELKKNKSYRNIFVIGDININIEDNTTDTRVPDYEGTLATHGLFPVSRLVTREESGACLDHIMAKSNLNMMSLVCKTDITDHYPVLCFIEEQKPNRNTIQIKRTINYKSIEDELKTIQWDAVTKEKDSNTACTNFIQIIKELILKNTEIKNISHRMRYIQPWITSSLIRCIQKRDKLHLTTRNNPNDIELKDKYIKYRNMCRIILLNVREQYYSSKIKSNIENKRKTWQIIKEAADKSSDKPITKLKEEQCESYNEYFNKIGSKLAQDTLNRLKTTEAQLLRIPRSPKSFRHSASLFLLPSDADEVRRVILSLKNYSAPGWDDIGTEFYKKMIKYIVHPITYIINLSLETGIFPEALKKGIIIPIHKSGNKNEIKNYRPITLLPVMSKILEKIVKIRLTKYIEKYNLISELQFGFQTNKSTTHALEELTKYVTDNLDKGRHSIGIFLDMAKAFDTISIKLLLDKLENIGIRGTALNWFKTYLEGRKQVLRVKQTMSKELEVKYGVPQGSVLGPILFLLYVNELTELNINGKCVCFADDTVLLFSAETWNDVYLEANTGMNTIKRWLDANLLTLNTGKTKYLSFAISARSADPEMNYIKVHQCLDPNNPNCPCEMLERVNAITYLGILVDNRLSWVKHVHCLAGRIRKLMFFFKRVKNIMDENLRLTVYYALCQSVITYGISSWGGSYKSHMIYLERSQRMVLKVIYGKNFQYSTEQLYKEAGVMSVRQLYISTILTNLKYTGTGYKPGRRAPLIPLPRIHTSFARRHSSFLSISIFNKISKIIGIHIQQNNHTRKVLLHKYLKQLNYNETEALLEAIQ